MDHIEAFWSVFQKVKAELDNKRHTFTPLGAGFFHKPLGYAVRPLASSELRTRIYLSNMLHGLITALFTFVITSYTIDAVKNNIPFR